MCEGLLMQSLYFNPIGKIAILSIARKIHGALYTFTTSWPQTTLDAADKLH